MMIKKIILVFIIIVLAFLLGALTSWRLITTNYDFLFIAEENSIECRDGTCLTCSEGLQERLTKAGYNSRMVGGWLNESDWRYYTEVESYKAGEPPEDRTPHAWVIVEIPIEATTGTIIPIEKIN